MWFVRTVGWQLLRTTARAANRQWRRQRWLLQIEEVHKIPKRASPRLAQYNDVDSMQKAKKWAAWKNLDLNGGNNSNFSFFHFPSVDIAASISNLGVGLGDNPGSVSDSISLLRTVEMARTRTEPSRTEVLAKSDFFSDDDQEELDDVMPGNLCGGLLEGTVEDDSDRLSCDFRTVFRKKKQIPIFG